MYLRMFYIFSNFVCKVQKYMKWYVSMCILLILVPRYQGLLNPMFIYTVEKHFCIDV